MYLLLEQYQQGLTDLDHSILLNQNYALAYKYRGPAYGLLNQKQRAIQDYKTAIRLDSNDGSVYACLAIYSSLDYVSAVTI